jgi:hypothetical protein
MIKLREERCVNSAMLCEQRFSLRAASTCVMTCDSTCDFNCDSVPASECQRKGMRCHDDAGTESQVITQVHTGFDHLHHDLQFDLRFGACDGPPTQEIALPWCFTRQRRHRIAGRIAGHNAGHNASGNGPLVLSCYRLTLWEFVQKSVFLGMKVFDTR